MSIYPKRLLQCTCNYEKGRMQFGGHKGTYTLLEYLSYLFSSAQNNVVITLSLQEFKTLCTNVSERSCHFF